ncbi:type II toxin-antitoxin system Phd/YefM family antitoxin [Janibacter cremeus]|uniref:type II toxin-antitoxin system Phd/YefM family antitoxin n=1 Tax=Janibacter cremeus TaxID=1285192 RepID=UPI0023F6A75D|nr:type II toxin-antitoxin system Phd/YefM family antitoxin [Janibacter cremeus]WEV78751.1 type II toxin-antitoxin system Phd/YefM family antitoxin [Janibacter cremeus]
MREMTASEASRGFSAVLDLVEHGETVVVTRGGRRLATIAPATLANGAELRSVFERWHGHPAVDDRFVEHVESARDGVALELDSDPWLD